MTIFSGLSKLDKTYQYLLIAFGFLIPITVAGANVSLGLIVLIWLFSGDYKNKLQQIVSNKLAIVSIIFFTIHLIGLLWTEDIVWGLYVLKKMWCYLLALPILMTLVKKPYIKYYISSFVLAMTLSEVASYLVWFEIVSPFYKLSVHDPSGFAGHIAYNPLLAFTFYLIAYEALFNQKLSNIMKFMYAFFSITIAVNMFITGGRAGQVVFFMMVSILIFQYFSHSKIKAFLLAILINTIIFITAYLGSTLFNARVNQTIDSLTTYQQNKQTSVGLRLTWGKNSLEIIKEHPWFGVGTGDFLLEYEKINKINTPEIHATTNPHNMYILILVELGVFGLLGMLWLFFLQFKIALYNHNQFLKSVGIVLPLMFLLMMFSESYLFIHHTKLLFIFFSAFLYKDYAKD